MFSQEEINTLETPCFIFDRSKLNENFRAFHSALQKHWGNYVLSYSVKTNPLPWLVAYALNEGCYAEVVSDDEYNLALILGYSPAEIVFNGPIKSRRCIESALKAGSIVNLESDREIDWIEALKWQGPTLKVGLRVNIDLESYCPGETVTGATGGRFGFSLETGHLQEIINRIKKLQNIEICGLHLHFTTVSRSLNVYETLAGFAVKISRDFNLNLMYVDVGGGFYGGGKNVGAYDNYAKVLSHSLRKHFNPDKTKLIVEPGGALVSTPCDFVARVVDVNITSRDCFVVTEASRLHLDHERKKERYVTTVINQHNENSIVEKRQVICGYTCLESDRLCVLENQAKLASGDIIIFHNAGAYSVGFIPTFFIRHSPVVYVRDEDKTLRKVRSRLEVKHCLLGSDTTINKPIN